MAEVSTFRAVCSCIPVVGPVVGVLSVLGASRSNRSTYIKCTVVGSLLTIAAAVLAATSGFFILCDIFAFIGLFGLSFSLRSWLIDSEATDAMADIRANRFNHGYRYNY